MLNTNKLILAHYKIRVLVLWFCIITLGFSATRPVAVMSKVIGDVKVDPVTDPGWRSATWGGKLFDGDQLQTGEASFSSIMFLDRSLVKIRANSKFTIKSKRTVKRELDTEINMKVGELNLTATKGSQFKIHTPTSVASVKGTELNLLVNEDGTSVLTVIEGTVVFMNEMGEVLATEMTTSISSANEAPSEPKEIQKNELPTWVGKVKEEWRLNLSPDKPGGKDVGKPFNLQITVEDAKDGKMSLDYNNEVNLSSSGAEFVFSVDGGQNWTPDAVVKLTKGRGVIKGKSIASGKSTLAVSGGSSSPGELSISTKQQETSKTKTEQALEKVDPGLTETLAGKRIMASWVSKGTGSFESIIEAINSGTMEVTSKDVIENPDGTIRVILRVNFVEGSNSGEEESDQENEF